MRYLLILLFLVISFPSLAAPLFVKMPIAPDNPIYKFEDFKARYFELTGELVQQDPLENDMGTHYLIGSSRITQAIADRLTSEFPMVSIVNTWPGGWVTKGE